MLSVNQVLPAAVAAGLAATTVVFSSGDLPADRDLNTAAAIRTSTGATNPRAVPNASAELPLTFVENRGQIHSSVRYYVQGSRSSFFFTDDQIVMSFGGPDQTAALVERSGGVALALRFIGRAAAMRIDATRRAPGEINYLRGRDSTRWHTRVPRFEQIVYREVWPGIDMVVSGRRAELKYEFRVGPGARPSDIRLSYAGANRLSLDADGALRIHTPLGPVRDSAPVAWQDIDGARVPVTSRYLLANESGSADSFAFDVGAYNPEHELVIDPDLDYSTFLGGSSMDRAAGIAVDASGNTYVVGTTQSTDFPTRTGAFDRTFNGGTTDVFVAKLDATGAGLVYATYLGGVPTPLRRGTGDNIEFGRAIAVDADGHAYITGITDSSDFPTTGGAFMPTINATPDSARDAFVTKLTPSGSGLVYSTFLGGSGHDDGWSIAVDAAGTAYVAGDTGSADFPITSGAAQASRGGGRDAFVAALNAAGSALVYGTYLGGLDNEVGNGIALDTGGHAFVVGGSRSADFPTTPGAFQTAHSGGTFENLFEAFVARLNSTGGLVYATFLGGSRIDVANDVAIDGGGNAYVVGSSSSPEFPTTAGAFDRTSGGSFVAKLTGDGSSLVFSTFLRGGGNAAIAVDASNKAWVAGTASAGAPATPGAFREQNSGGSDAWLGQLSVDGSALEFATFIGASNSDNGTGLALGASGGVFITGTTLSFDFPTSTGAFDTTFGGDPAIFWGDGFVAKFGSGAATVNPEPTRTTSTFSGSLDKNRAAFHSVLVGAAGPVDLTLDWTDDTRARLTLRVRDPAGTEVFFDGSSARPKVGRFDATVTGSYSIEVANVSDRRATYTLTVTYPVSSSQSGGVSFVALDPETVTGGSSSTGTVALTVGAPAGGAVVALASSNEAAATVPASVTVPEGLTTATFTVLTNSVSANTTSTISATYNGSTRSATLGVNAAGGPALSTLALDPVTVPGGSSSTGTVTLTGAAPAGGAVVTLISSNTDTAAVPPSVTVPEGSTTATFAVSTSQVTFDSSSAISASHGGVTRTVILSVTAGSGSTEPPPPTGTATLTVTATGRSGERVTSNPTGINVSVGSTGSASFAVGTTITLSVTNGRDAIWSGACSTGGEKERTCAFTLNADASVTANVQ